MSDRLVKCQEPAQTGSATLVEESFVSRAADTRANV